MKEKPKHFSSIAIIICIFLNLNLFGFYSIAQEDTLYIHTSENIDYYPLNQVDSLNFYYGNSSIDDSIFIWTGNYICSKYLVSSIDSITFTSLSTIHPHLIPFCNGIPFYTDIRDQNTYRTVKIGNQCWLRENLRYLPNVFQPDSTSISESRFYVYNYFGNNVLSAQLSQNYQLFGPLYNWKAATQVCPKGWRLPSNEDWDELQQFLINNLYNFDNTSSDNKIAKSLSGSKSIQQNGLWTNSIIPGTPGDFTFELMRNLSGFSILPAGYLSSQQFVNINDRAYFWSIDNIYDSLNLARYLEYNNIAFNSELFPKDFGFSVRCISKRLQIITDSVTDLRQNKAILNARLIVGPEPVILKGFYWKKTTDSTWNIEILLDENFSKVLFNLDTSTTYEYFAFVYSINDSLYGDTISFTTYSYPICPGLPTFVDIRDNEVYSTVLIGNQCWMKENLRYLPIISSVSNYESVPKYFVYGYTGNDLNEAKTQTNYLLYGVLYNWKAALDGIVNSSSVPSGLKGICPKGWHLPSQNEFLILSDFLGGSTIAGIHMKTSYLWSNSSNGNNSSHFSALPGGKLYNTTFSDQLNQGYFWTSTSLSTYFNHLAFNLNSSTVSLEYLYDGANNSSFSLRCLKNELIMSIDSIVNITLNSAKIYGIITPGYDSTYSKGISWKLVNDSIWNNISIGTMLFNTILSGLNPNSIYQVRCYVVDSIGYKYSDTTNFITAHLLPIPRIPYLYFVNNNTAIIKSTITPGTNSNFYYWLRFKDVNNLQWNYLYNTGFQNMDTLHNLLTNHSYTIQLMLVCGNDTIYSQSQFFVTTKTIPCPGLQIYTDPRDSNTYNTVFVNNTCWLKENLRYLPSVVSSATISNTIPYFYVYNFNDTNVVNAKNTPEYQTTGVLYNWPAALNGDHHYNGLPSAIQGICPPGWQLPSLSEWSKLKTFLTQDSTYYISNCGTGSIAKALTGSVPISQGGLWTDVNTNCAAGDTTYYYKRNLTGMTFLPGGYLNYHSFNSYNAATLLWSSSYALQSYANGCQLSYIDPSFFTSMVTVDSKTGMSIRCVKQNFPIIQDIYVSDFFRDKVTINGKIISGINTTLTKGIKYKVLEDSVWTNIYVTNDSIHEIIQGLDTATKYEFYIYAYTNSDSIYSSTVKFQTLGFKSCPEVPFLLDTRDNSIYTTAKIGNQCWIRENLRYLPIVYHPDSISNINARYYVYGFYSNNIDSAKIDSLYQTFGTLYNYMALENACPVGWHIPKTFEWDTLKKNLILFGYNYTQQLNGNKIAKAMTGSNPILNGGYWTNSLNIGSPGNIDFPDYRNVTTLNFLPSGYFQENNFRGKDSISAYWIKNFDSDTLLKTSNIYYDRDSLFYTNNNIEEAFNARCVKNRPPEINIQITYIYPTYIFITTSIVPGTDPLVNYSIKVKPISGTNWQNTEALNTEVVDYEIFSLQSYVTYQMIAEIRTAIDTTISDTILFTTPATPHSFSNLIFNNKETNSITFTSQLIPGSVPVLDKGIQYRQIDSVNWITIYSLTDSINIQITGLMPKQRYKLRLFIHDINTTTYSIDTLFTTLWNSSCINLPTFYDLRDSNIYRTIQIGNQCWMRDNLRFLPNIYNTNNNSTDSARFYVYNYNGTSIVDAKNSIYYNSFGVLYNAFAAHNGYIMDTFVPITNQGICPNGWHLPTNNEYDTLFNYLKINGYACSELINDFKILISMVASQPISLGGLWVYSNYYETPGNEKYQNIRNNSGFNAIPSGYKSLNTFSEMGNRACFWTNSIPNTYIYFRTNATQPYLGGATNNYSYSVRCVKN